MPSPTSIDLPHSSTNGFLTSPRASRANSSSGLTFSVGIRSLGEP